MSKLMYGCCDFTGELLLILLFGSCVQLHVCREYTHASCDMTVPDWELR